jgi:hypothetical protein
LKDVLDRIDLANIPALAASVQALRNVIERNVSANEFRSRQIKTEHVNESISTRMEALMENLGQHGDMLTQILAKLK